MNNATVMMTKEQREKLSRKLFHRFGYTIAGACYDPDADCWWVGVCSDPGYYYAQRLANFLLEELDSSEIIINGQRYHYVSLKEPDDEISIVVKNFFNSVKS